MKFNISLQQKKVAKTYKNELKEKSMDEKKVGVIVLVFEILGTMSHFYVCVARITNSMFLKIYGFESWNVNLSIYTKFTIFDE